MAHVTLPDGRSFDVADSDTDALAYYRGEGASIVQDSVDAPPSLPAVFDGEQYVDAPAFIAPEGTVDTPPETPPTDGDEAVPPVNVEQLPDGETAEATGPIVGPATGEPMTGYQVPPNSDGTFGPATLGPDGATAEVDGETVDLQPDTAPAAKSKGK